MDWGTHMVGMVGERSDAVEPQSFKCVLCGFRLGMDLDDDEAKGVCADCKDRPEAKRLGKVGAQAGAAGPRKSAREFTEAERSLIKKVHGYMQPSQLLTILNERLACDLGPDAMPYTMEQLHSEVGETTGCAKEGARDWASLRKLMARARRSGVLGKIDEQVVHDFAVVFQLNAKQVMSIKDIVLRGGEEE